MVSFFFTKWELNKFGTNNEVVEEEEEEEEEEVVLVVEEEAAFLSNHLEWFLSTNPTPTDPPVMDFRL